MKISRLFDLITDVKDILDYFERVDSPEQLVSRLERLKRQAPDDLMACIEGLRMSVTSLLEDTFEMSASLDEPEDSADDLDAEIAALAADSASEEQNPGAEPTVTAEKKIDPPTT